ncbi:MAG: autotransporter-associated N-terminal domain-containing protein, partial [Leptotrichiaceae bacterium]|nr:autotransporter-associated N-terminal domain-containing protein [Leptotrichiaceae bacterium]
MNNSLRRLEKNLRSYAKRCKDVKYTSGLLLTFLLTGMLSLSTTSVTNLSIEQQRQSINNSISDMKQRFRRAKRENNKLLKNANLELIQLMEQGDQVVKSPWSSLQFGANYYYNSWNGVYKGRGDKSEKYSYNDIYIRPSWKIRNASNTLGNVGVNGLPITPGNDSQISWENVSTSSGGVSIVKNLDINSSVNGRSNWGLVDLIDIEEPINEIEILARISPKKVDKEAVKIDITVDEVPDIIAPNIDPQVNTPLTPPIINIPEVELVNITPLNISTPSAPTALQAPTINISFNAPSAPVPPSVEVSPTEPSSPTPPSIDINVVTPQINILTIANPSVPVLPTVISPEIKPVDFTVAPAGNSSTRFISSNWQTSFNNLPTVINVTSLINRDYISLNGSSGNGTTTLSTSSNQIININEVNNRALIIDETRDGTTVIHNGTINLLKSKNVGIDLQGTHRGTMTSPAITTVINSGSIIGHSDGINNKEQIAFGFNNADASNNTTMTHMINRKIITLNSPSSAGIQLKPEDPHNWIPSNWNTAPLQISSRTTQRTLGRVLMKADNEGDINVNGTGSFGIVTIFNNGVPIDLFAPSFLGSFENLKSERSYAGVRVLPGGEIGRSALTDSKYTSGIYNRSTGNINITGDNSIGVGLLQEIQEVKIGGNINIGTTSVTQVNNISNITSKSTSKVEESVGVFAGVPTMPVKVGESDTLITSNTATSGNINNTGAIIGTETLEISGNITLGEHSSSSIGALVGDTEVDLNNGLLNGVNSTNRKLRRSGDITARSTSVITVGGEKNYGFVVNNSSHSSKFSTATIDNLIYSVSKSTNGKGINEGRINVTGKESVGFAMIKGGNSSNSGTISVQNLSEGAIGFYGKEDQFINSGTIEITSSKKNNIGVVLDGASNFTNSGNIFVNVSENSNSNLSGEGNVGVYAQGMSYIFNHIGNSSEIKIGKDGVGLYLVGTGTANINSKIELSESDKGTTIGVYSDGNSNVLFGIGSILNIGKGAVGLYSLDASKFNNTFKIKTGEKLVVSLGENSALALLSGNTNSSISLKSFLNNNANDKIEIDSFGSGASLFYVKDGSKAVLDENYNITTGGLNSTSVLVGTGSGSKVEISSGKTLKTNTHVGLVATDSSTAENSGILESTRNNGVGIYASQSTAINSTTGAIKMTMDESVGILGENNSTLKNSKDITLLGRSSAGIYGKDSNIEQDTTAKIDVEKETSAGIYSILTSNANTDKKVENKGSINVKSTGTGNSAGIYANLDSSATGKLEVANSGQINVSQNNSVGVYAKNESNSTKDKSVVNNSGLVKIEGGSSVGIIGEKATIANTGVGTNGIEVNSLESAAILVKTNSEVVNTGKILLSSTVNNATDGLVGISLDATSTANNSGNIEVKSNYSTGISTSGGKVTNNGNITLENKNSVGVSSINADVDSNSTGNIKIQNEESVGIYAKLTGSVDKTINNSGNILLESPTVTTPKKSAGIYAFLDSSASGKLTAINNGNIEVGQEESAGIYSVNNSSQSNGQSVGINNKTISVTKSGSAAMIGEKSNLSNTSTASGEGIRLSSVKTAGIIGKLGSSVTNSGNIETLSATPSGATDGLVGISLNSSTGENTATGKIILGTEYSTGIYGENASTAENKGDITANKKYAVGMAGKSSTLTNSSTINLKDENSTGIYGEGNSTLLNSGTIIAEKASSVGLFAKENTSTTINTGTIKASGNTSAGMYGEKSRIENSNSIVVEGTTSAGMYAKNTSAE